MKLVEDISFDGAEFVEEGGKRVVKNVAMLGAVSSHGYEYEQEAMRGAVRGGLYEGVRIFINHDQGQRDVMHLAGVFRDSRHEDGKVRGNAHLLDDDYGRKFFNIAKEMPTAASCSHIADGRLVTRDGKRVVEQITAVHSVDLVVQGATTRSVFEADEEPPTTMAVPRPYPGDNGQPREKQYEFISRCVEEVRANNDTITPAQATALCFTAWSSRYESDGMDEGTVTVPIPPAEVFESEPDVTDPETENTEGHRPQHERTKIMNDLDKQFEQLEQDRAQASRLLTIDPLTEPIVKRESHEQADREYAERQRAKPTARQIQEASSALDSGRETDHDFTERMAEKDKSKHPEKYLTEREKRELNECLQVGEPGALIG